MIEAIGVSVRHGNHTQALEDVTLSVKEGEFAVLLGPSGSGKSTFLRYLNGLVNPSAGEVLLKGVHLGERRGAWRDVRRRIGMVFQHFQLLKMWPALHNVLVGRLGHKPLRHAWWFTRGERAMALKALERVGLAQKAHVRAGALSGGEQQRVGIARALVQQPDLILADEPVASLDPMTAHEILSLLRQINREERVTLLCSLHQVDLARRFGDRVFGLCRGRVVFEGEAAALDQADLGRIYGNGNGAAGGGPVREPLAPGPR
jgi:phosphonate transport system ATP-binding protein